MEAAGPHATPHPASERVVQGAAGSLGSVLSGLVAAVFGITPHVLHHVGPLAGTALLAGSNGTIIFGVAGFALSIPMLLRIRRRFGSWLAPSVASVIFLVVYLFSSLVIGPAITGASAIEPEGAPPSTTLPSGHDDHHP
jgi:hypothetical protein